MLQSRESPQNGHYSRVWQFDKENAYFPYVCVCVSISSSLLFSFSVSPSKWENKIWQMTLSILWSRISKNTC